MEFIVTNTRYGANLRSLPRVLPQTLIDNLPFATRVNEIGPIQGRWRHVEVVNDENNTTGLVSDKNLRPAGSAKQEALIASIAYYWELFDRGKGKEAVEPYQSYVYEMWDALGLKDKVPRTDHPDWPWSAAGMSAFIRHAEYEKFTFSALHAIYIHESIIAKLNNAPRDFFGYRLNERKPRVGDLVCRARQQGVTYDYASKKNDFLSHTDVIVELRESYIWTIGANNQNSVSRVRYDLTDSGHLSDKKSVFALMSLHDG